MPSTCSSLQHAPPAHLARGAGLALPPRLGSRTRLTSGACRAARAPMSPVHTALDSTPSSSTCSALVGSSGSGSMNGNSCHAARPLGGPYARPGSTSTSSAPGLPQHSVPSRAALVRTSVLDRQGSAAGYGNAEAWASQQQPHGTGQEEARAHGSWQQPSAAESESRQRDEEADHSGNQITLFLSMSVTLITLPWVYHHPETLLVPAALLALPMPGSALRPALLEGITMVLSAAKWIHRAQSHSSSTSGSTASVAQSERPLQHPHAANWHAGGSAPSSSMQHGGHAYGHSQPAPYHPTHSHAHHTSPPAYAPAPPRASGTWSESSGHASTAGHMPHNNPGAHEEYNHMHYAGGPGVASEGAYAAPLHWAPAVPLEHNTRHTQPHDAELDCDWPATSGSSDVSNHGASASGSGGAGGQVAGVSSQAELQAAASSLSRHQRHPQLYHNLEEVGAAGGGGSSAAANAAGPASAYGGHEAAASYQPSAAGPCSTWPRSRPQPQAPLHQHPQAQHQQHSAAAGYGPTPTTQSQVAHPPLQPPAGAVHLPTPSAFVSEAHGPGPAHDTHAQQPLHGGSGAGGRCEPDAAPNTPVWATPLFSVAPWMRSWGGFL